MTELDEIKKMVGKGKVGNKTGCCIHAKPITPPNPSPNVCIDEKLLPMLKDVIKRLQIIVEAIEDKHGG